MKIRYIAPYMIHFQTKVTAKNYKLSMNKLLSQEILVLTLLILEKLHVLDKKKFSLGFNNLE